MLTLISNRLKEEYGISIGVMELRSMGDHKLESNILAKIEECSEYFTELEESIEVIDSVSHPYGIYQYFQNYATTNGTHHYTTMLFTEKNDKGEVKQTEKRVYDRYEPNNPNEFVIGIVDHLSLLATEKAGEATTLHGAMTQMSAEYGRKMITKRYNYCLLLVQQQAAASEQLQYTNSGISIEAKLEPSLNGLGD